MAPQSASIDPAVRPKRWHLLALPILSGVALAVAALATDKESLGGSPFVWVLVCAALFNMLSAAAAWIFTERSERRFLVGSYPFVLGAAKVAAFIGVSLLILLAVATLLIGSPLRDLALRSLVRGAVASVVVSMVMNGLLNTLLVVRHFRGTLATTSEERS